MDEEFGSLAETSAAAKSISGGLEVSQLRDYVEELERRQLKVVQDARLSKEENEQRARDQADVYYYLNKKLDDNYDVIHTMEEQIIREQSEREISESEYEQIIEQLNAKIASDESKYQNKILDLEDKLDIVREYMGKKEEMQQKLDDLTKTLEKERAESHMKCEDMDKRRIQEKAQLKEDFQIELEALKRHHKSDIDSKLSSKAKKSAILNVMYKKELQYQVLYI